MGEKEKIQTQKGHKIPLTRKIALYILLAWIPVGWLWDLLGYFGHEGVSWRTFCVANAYF